MVKITLQALCLSMLSYTIASPLATTTTTTETEALEAVSLSKRAQNRCEWYIGGNGNVYCTVWMGGWGNNDGTSRGGCGSGFLDNIRGQCGGAFDWGCTEIHENPHDTMTTFNFWSGQANAQCAEEAFRLASPGQSQRVNCVRI